MTTLKSQVESLTQTVNALAKIVQASANVAAPVIQATVSEPQPEAKASGYVELPVPTVTAAGFKVTVTYDLSPGLPSRKTPTGVTRAIVRTPGGWGGNGVDVKLPDGKTVKITGIAREV